jgi:hypothetical protein
VREGKFAVMGVAGSMFTADFGDNIDEGNVVCLWTIGCVFMSGVTFLPRFLAFFSSLT